MPVGTQGTVKGVDAGRLRETGAQMVLANTYHLALRPGEQTVAPRAGHQIVAVLVGHDQQNVGLAAMWSTRHLDPLALEVRETRYVS